METLYKGEIFYFDKRIRWLFNILAFLAPWIPSNFIKQNPWNIILPTITILLPLAVEGFYLVVRGWYFKSKLIPILKKKKYKIKATGMFIDPTFKRDSNDYNNKVKVSDEYIIKLFINYSFWKNNLSIIAKNTISGKDSSSSISTLVNVYFESKYSIKISYNFNNCFVENKQHKSKQMSEFNGTCNLHFNEFGEIIDYYYVSDGKNRFSFLKEWKNVD